MFVFDIETNGLLPGQGEPPHVSRIHCINGIDVETGEEFRYTDHEFYQDVEGNVTDERCPRNGDLKAGIERIKQAGSEAVAGHNICGYDLPVLRYLTGDNTIPSWGFDTKALGKLAYPTLKDKDFININKGKLKGVQAGGQRLKDWGIRLGGEQKADFKPSDYGHTWATIPFIKDMDDYCMQDCRTNVGVYKAFIAQNMSDLSVYIECRVAEILGRQERHGIRFDEKSAEKLAETLYIKKHELEQQARKSFAPFYTKKGKKVSYKKDSRRFIVNKYGGVTRKYKGETQRGWWCHVTGGHEVAQPIEKIEFNPGSRVQIENRLRWKYDWEPNELTKKGRAKIDETTLGSLPFKEARIIAEYFTVDKRLGQLAEGDNAWLKKVRNGRIYGRVDQLGCVTSRMSHFSPNLAQVPANHAPYGEECRQLFVADHGRVIVGCDADALELRVLAHFLAMFDSGAYIKTVLEGRKEDGTDMHSRNRDAVRLVERDTAKTWFYAFIYGAADFKLGTIVMSEWSEEKLLKFYRAFPPGQKRRSRITSIGRTSRARLISTIPAFGALSEEVQYRASRGHLKGLDGRRLPVRAMHAALNTLCQGAGAIIMKLALVLMFDEFDSQGLDVIPLLNVHDEVQLSCLEEEAKAVGEIAADAIRRAGERFKFRCPLAGDYAVGPDWSKTH